MLLPLRLSALSLAATADVQQAQSRNQRTDECFPPPPHSMPAPGSLRSIAAATERTAAHHCAGATNDDDPPDQGKASQTADISKLPEQRSPTASSDRAACASLMLCMRRAVPFLTSVALDAILIARVSITLQPIAPSHHSPLSHHALRFRTSRSDANRQKQRMKEEQQRVLIRTLSALTLCFVTAAARAPLAPLTRRSLPLARAAASSVTASLLPRSAIAAPVCVRGFAVTNAFERSANTSEFMDFDTARKDLNKWRKQLLYRSRQRGQGDWPRMHALTRDPSHASHRQMLIASLFAAVCAGWLELDLIMGTWADENLAKLDAKSLEQVCSDGANLCER